MVKLNTKRRSAGARTSGSKAGLAGKAVELKITLRYVKPRIWRSFVVPGGIRLDRLHDVIQIVMGWTDSHLHSFHSGRCEYTMPYPEQADWLDMVSDTIVLDERKHSLGDIVTGKGDRFTYTYDFGDNWEHDLRVAGVTPMDVPLECSFCVRGERACPPEDCGSVPGYEELCEALRDPKHPEHLHWKRWAGDFDPEAFICDEVNQLLMQVRI